TVRWRQPGCTEHVAYSPEGKYVASCGCRGIVLWDAATGKRAAFLQGERLAVIGCLVFSPNGRYLAAGQKSAALAYNPVHVWEVTAGKLWLVPDSTRQEVEFVAFTPDGAGVFVGTASEIWLTEVSTGRELVRWELPRGDACLFEARAVSPDGALLAAITCP